MEEVIVTRLWMAGVVGMMLVFATIAVVGLVKQNKRRSGNQSAEPDE